MEIVTKTDISDNVDFIVLKNMDFYFVKYLLIAEIFFFPD